MSWFVQERSPSVHHAEPGQLALGGLGTAAQGAANHDSGLPGGSVTGLVGSDPSLHGLVQSPPPPATQELDENPAAFTNSSVTSRASKVAPPRHIPPPPANPEPLK